jgi:hypothetical protein
MFAPVDLSHAGAVVFILWRISMSSTANWDERSVKQERAQARGLARMRLPTGLGSAAHPSSTSKVDDNVLRCICYGRLPNWWEQT